MRIFVKGFGCSSSIADTEVLAGCLKKAGHAIVNNLQAADLVLYNTCAVKTPTENRIISLLKKIPQEKKLVITGCLPLINFNRLKKEVRFDAVGGPALGTKVVDIVEEVSIDSYAESTCIDRFSDDMPKLILPRIRAKSMVSIIPISYGCLGSCSYCCVRFARGRLRSYVVEEILDKVKADVADNVHEFWLTSQDTACYGRDIATNLPNLLTRVCRVEGDFLIRVGMMTPNHLFDFFDALIDAFKNDKVFKFLHLPLQSGDNTILKRMKRFYSTEDYLSIIRKFRTTFPRSTIATDIITGFPGESASAFRRTIKLVEEIRPDILNISKFFARPKTDAGSMTKQITSSMIKHRSACLTSLAHKIATKRNKAWIGWKGRIFIDETGKQGSVVGRNFAYKPVVIRSSDAHRLLGKFVTVKVNNAFQSHLLGEII